MVQPGTSIRTMPVGTTANLPPDPWAAAKVFGGKKLANVGIID